MIKFKREIILTSIFYVLYSNVIAAEIPQSLRDAINQKSLALQEVNQQILQIQKELDSTEGKSKSLQKEISQTDYQLKQLNLSIRSSEINVEKLKLEIQALSYDIGKVGNSMDVKKSGIAQLLREVQQKDSENILVTFLKNKSFAESLFEFESLVDLNFGLSGEVNQLQVLNDELSDKLSLTSDKKNKVEIENRNLKNRKLIAENQKLENQRVLKETKNQEKLYAQQLDVLAKLQAEVSAEIEKIEAELRAKIDPSLLPLERPGVLLWPITLIKNGGLGRITQNFGIFSALYRGKAHNGMDIGAPIGTPIFASEKGSVLEVWDQDKYCRGGAYGKFIAIEHPNNLTTLYAHLSLQIAKKGEQVERGQLIGYVGKTGYATGPHLHFGVYASQTFIFRPSSVNCGPIMPFGGTLDPAKYL